MAQWHIERPDSPSKPIHQILSGIARGGFYVTNDNNEETSRAALLDALTDAGYPAPSPADPVYAHRADTGNLERNTGDGWVRVTPQWETGIIEYPAIANGDFATLTLAFTPGKFSAIPAVTLIPTSPRLTPSFYTGTPNEVTIRLGNYSGANAGAATAFWTALQ